jgi:hypothetical protein
MPVLAILVLDTGMSAFAPIAERLTCVYFVEG